MNRRCLVIKPWCLLLTAGLLAACSSDNNMAELEAYVQETVSRPPGQIEALPQFVTYQSFSYSAASLRGPFDVPVIEAAKQRTPDQNIVEPDEDRPKEFLESIAVGNLEMVGSLTKRGQVWALIQDVDNNIHRVTVGNYLGKNHGRIVATSEAQIDIIEIVPSGNGGWVERPRSIYLRNLEVQAQGGE